MKKIALLFLTAFFATTATQGFSQKLTSGDLTLLKGEKAVNITYDYSKMAVGKFATEAEYLNKAASDRNEKEPGTGDAFVTTWNNAKSEKYAPAFEEDFNKQAGDCGIAGKSDPSAKYTLVVHVKFLEQGVETVVMGTAKQASVDFQIDLVETASPDKVLASIEMDKIKPKAKPKMSVGGVSVSKTSYDATLRVAECFEMGGKQLGKFVCKSIK